MRQEFFPSSDLSARDQALEAYEALPLLSTGQHKDLRFLAVTRGSPTTSRRRFVKGHGAKTVAALRELVERGDLLEREVTTVAPPPLESRSARFSSRVRSGLEDPTAIALPQGVTPSTTHRFVAVNHLASAPQHRVSLKVYFKPIFLPFVSVRTEIYPPLVACYLTATSAYLDWLHSQHLERPLDSDETPTPDRVVFGFDDVLDCSFRSGLAHGKGTLRLGNGLSIKGSFEHGALHGVATIAPCEGDSREDSFVAGIPQTTPTAP